MPQPVLRELIGNIGVLATVEALTAHHHYSVWPGGGGYTRGRRVPQEEECTPGEYRGAECGGVYIRGLRLQENKCP